MASSGIPGAKFNKFCYGQTRRAEPGRAGQICELRRLGVSSRNAVGFAALCSGLICEESQHKAWFLFVLWWIDWLSIDLICAYIELWQWQRWGWGSVCYNVWRRWECPLFFTFPALSSRLLFIYQRSYSFSYSMIQGFDRITCREICGIGPGFISIRTYYGTSLFIIYL